MSWIEKELRKRVAESKATGSAQPGPEPEAGSASKRIADLWADIRSRNSALPEAIQLLIDTNRTSANSPEDAMVLEWLRARNGAAIGYTGNAIRYSWPERSAKRSKNFWIRWSAKANQYIINQRISAAIPPVVAEYRFNEKKIQQLMRCLVQSKRVKIGSIRKRRLWIF